MLSRTKIDPAVVQDLQLAPVEPIKPMPGLKPMPEPEPEVTQPYDSIQLLDRVLMANRTSTDLEELRTKAKFEQERIWQLRDGLLL